MNSVLRLWERLWNNALRPKGLGLFLPYKVVERGPSPLFDLFSEHGFLGLLGV